MTDRRTHELVLDLGEALRIGSVRVVVRERREAEIRLSIDAPPHLLVLRDELLRRRRRPNHEAP